MWVTLTPFQKDNRMDKIETATIWVQDKIEQNVKPDYAIQGAQKTFELNDAETESVKSVIEFRYN